MKAHLIDTHLLVPRSRSSAKVKVKYQDHFSQKMTFSQTHLVSVSQTYLVIFMIECLVTGKGASCKISFFAKGSAYIPKSTSLICFHQKGLLQWGISFLSIEITKQVFAIIIIQTLNDSKEYDF